MRLPSISARLARAVLSGSLVWSLAVSGAVWLAVRHEIPELLDATLRAAAQVMVPALAHETLPALAPLPATAADDEFGWQVVGPGPDGRPAVLLASSPALARPLHGTPSAGLHDTPGWHVYGAALGTTGRMLYVAQTRDARIEAVLEVAFSAALATLAVALLAHLWLRARARRELAPLQRLSERLGGLDLLAAGATLGTPERAELKPVHATIDALAAQLQRRLAHERAFTAHAAHALRTPLAGIDAQLAVALHECPPALRARLQRVRDGAGRLQRVVAALLALFRSGAALQREAQPLPEVLARLPLDGLAVDVEPGAVLHADGDLLTAALLNLLDNAQRHGARHVAVSTPAPNRLRLHDDGPGVPDARRAALQQALDTQAYDGGTGLGLMLADMVARAHGGRLRLPSVNTGFAVELELGPVDTTGGHA